MITRKTRLAAIQSKGEVDVLIIGAGVNGAGLFRDLRIDIVASPAIGGIVIGQEVAKALAKSPSGSNIRAIFAERNAQGSLTLRRGFTVEPNAQEDEIPVSVTASGLSPKSTYHDALTCAASGTSGDTAPTHFELDATSTQAMLDHANVLIAYKEYPHTDEVDRARELFTICHDAAMGRTRPMMALFDCKMISMWRTTLKFVCL